MKLLGFALLSTLVALAGCATGASTSFEDDEEDTNGSSSGGANGQGGTLVTGVTTTGTATGGSSAGGASGCPDGYEEVGGDCVDIDECAEGTDDCDPLVDCVNEEPGYSCDPCPSGYADVNADGTQCDDIDECAEMTDNCDPLAGCINDTPGFHCGNCPAGTTDVNGDGTSCVTTNEIGLDDRHGFSTTIRLGTGSNHATMRTRITNAGKTIRVMTAFDTADLSGLAAVFIQQPYTGGGAALTSTEITALVTFVNQGGGLVVIADGGSGGDQANLNLLSTNWGVTFSSSPQWPNGQVFSSLPAHPVTSGVASFGVDYGVPITVSSPSVALTNGTVALAAATGSGGSGNAVFVSDSCFSNSATADYNINSLSNATLLDNILDFVAN